MSRFKSDQARWIAVQKRDPDAHSAFIYAVITTNIFCRPTCPARLARRANIRFYNDINAAVAAGFRPCKRCKPDISGEPDSRRSAEFVNQACKIIDDVDGEVVMLEVAKSLGLSVRHLHNLFKDAMGCTPAIYAATVRQVTKAHLNPPIVATNGCSPADATLEQPTTETFDFNAGVHSNGSPASLTLTDTSWADADYELCDFGNTFQAYNEPASVLDVFDFELASLPPVPSEKLYGYPMDQSVPTFVDYQYQPEHLLPKT